MITRFLTITAVVMGGAAALFPAGAKKAYPVPPGAVWSPVPPPYAPPGGYAIDARRGPPPNFDQLEDDEANQAALPPPGVARAPGPILSPDDPRYANAVPNPNGPVMSPDDPRYGRPAGPPPVVYGDRAPGGYPPPPGYPPPGYDNRGYGDPNAPRPPEGVAPGG